jgi:hypothetical protein
MGVFYGLARKLENRGDAALSGAFRLLAVLVPALLHGALRLYRLHPARARRLVLLRLHRAAVRRLVRPGRESSRNDRYID